MTSAEFKSLKPNMIVYHVEGGKKVFGHVSAIYRAYPNLLGFSRFKDAWASWIPIDDPKDFHMASEAESFLWKLENA